MAAGAATAAHDDAVPNAAAAAAVTRNADARLAVQAPSGPKTRLRRNSANVTGAAPNSAVPCAAVGGRPDRATCPTRELECLRSRFPFPRSRRSEIECGASASAEQKIVLSFIIRRARYTHPHLTHALHSAEREISRDESRVSPQVSPARCRACETRVRAVRASGGRALAPGRDSPCVGLVAGAELPTAGRPRLRVRAPRAPHPRSY